MKTFAIISSLEGLALRDLKAIQRALDKELLKHSVIDQDLYFLLFSVIGQTPMKIEKFIRSELGVEWYRNQIEFNSFANKLLEGIKPTLVLIKALKKFLLELLIEDIKGSGRPFNMKTVCINMGNIEVVFERSFPGYLSSGLSKLIIKQLGG